MDAKQFNINGTSVLLKDEQARNRIAAVEGKLPSDASSSNKLITKTVDDLVNYYLKSETYTKSEVEALIGAIQHFHYEVYASTGAVTNPQSNVLYLIGPTGSGSDRYEEYVYTNNTWTKIGDTSIDLSGYVTTEALNTALAAYTTTANLTTLLAGKQDVIADLETIREKSNNAIQAEPVGQITPSVDPYEYATKAELDELGQEVNEATTWSKEIDLTQFTVENGSLGSTSWYINNSASPKPSHKAIPVSPNERYKLKFAKWGSQTSGVTNGWYVFVTSSYQTPVSGAIPSTGADKRLPCQLGTELSLTVPSNAAYLIITVVDGGSNVCEWNLKQLVPLKEIVVGGSKIETSDFEPWALSSSYYKRAYAFNERLVHKGDTIKFKLSAYDTYKIGVTVAKTKSFTGESVYDTGWKQEDIEVTFTDSEAGYYVRVSVGKVANADIDLTEFLSSITELTYEYEVGSDGLMRRVNKLEEMEAEDRFIPSRIPMVVLNSPYYVGRKIDVSNHGYQHTELGTLTSVTDTVQGFAIFGDYLFQCHNKMASVVVFKLSTGESIQTISLTPNASNHANSAGFGNQYYDNGDSFPCLYVSSEGEKKVYVYRITGTEGAFAMTLVQTISFVTDFYYPNLHIDAPNSRGVIIGYKANSWNTAENNKMRCCCVDLPDVTAGDVTLTETYGEFTFPFIYATQGAIARYGKLYTAFGNTSAGLNIGGILVIDYILKNVESFLDLKYVGNLEPEGVGIWDDGLVITTQARKVIKINP